MTGSVLPRVAIVSAVVFAVFGVGFALALYFHGAGLPAGFELLCRWDCSWYAAVAANGYDLVPHPDTLQANWAFFPAFPFAVRAVMLATGLGFVPAALLLNAIYAVLFVWLALAGRETLQLRSDRDAAVFVLAFMLAPVGLYNHVPYTEMQFNLAMLATFVAWRRGQFFAAAICGIVLTATRPTGIFLPVALLLELVWQERWRVLHLLGAPDARFRALAAMPLGIFGFFGLLAVVVGDPLASLRVQPLGWAYGARNPIETIAGGLQSLSPVGVVSVFSFVISVGLLIVGWATRRIPVPLVLTGFGIAYTGIFDGLHATSRYMLAIFPIYLAVPLLPRWLHWPAIVALAAVQIVFIRYYPSV